MIKSEGSDTGWIALGSFLAFGIWSVIKTQFSKAFYVTTFYFGKIEAMCPFKQYRVKCVRELNSIFQIYAFLKKKMN